MISVFKPLIPVRICLSLLALVSEVLIIVFYSVTKVLRVLISYLNESQLQTSFFSSFGFSSFGFASSFFGFSSTFFSSSDLSNLHYLIYSLSFPSSSELSSFSSFFSGFAFLNLVTSDSRVWIFSSFSLIILSF